MNINFVPTTELSPQDNEKRFSGKQLEMSKDGTKNSEITVVNTLVEQVGNKTFLRGLVEPTKKGKGI